MMICGKRHGRDGQSGQSLVEFAIVLPIMLVLLSGLFEMSRAILMKAELDNCCADCVRTIEASDDTMSDAELLATLNETAPSGMSFSSSTMAVTRSTTAKEAYQYHLYDSTDSKFYTPRASNFAYKDVTVTLSADVKYVTPIGPIFQMVGNDTFNKAGYTLKCMHAGMVDMTDASTW